MALPCGRAILFTGFGKNCQGVPCLQQRKNGASSGTSSSGKIGRGRFSKQYRDRSPLISPGGSAAMIAAARGSKNAPEMMRRLLKLRAGGQGCRLPVWRRWAGAVAALLVLRAVHCHAAGSGIDGSGKNPITNIYFSKFYEVQKIQYKSQRATATGEALKRHQIRTILKSSRQNNRRDFIIPKKRRTRGVCPQEANLRDGRKNENMQGLPSWSRTAWRLPR